MFGDNFDPPEDGLPEQLIHKLNTLQEMLEAMEAREGKEYTNFVASLFSITNVYSTQAILLSHCASEDMLEVVAPLEGALKSQISTIILFAALLLVENKNPAWILLSKQEKKEKVKQIALQIGADVTMLMKQQTGENHAPI